MAVAGGLVAGGVATALAGSRSSGSVGGAASGGATAQGQPGQQAQPRRQGKGFDPSQRQLVGPGGGGPAPRSAGS